MIRNRENSNAKADLKFLGVGGWGVAASHAIYFPTFGQERGGIAALKIVKKKCTGGVKIVRPKGGCNPRNPLPKSTKGMVK